MAPKPPVRASQSKTYSPSPPRTTRVNRVTRVITYPIKISGTNPRISNGRQPLHAPENRTPRASLRPPTPPAISGAPRSNRSDGKTLLLCRFSARDYLASNHRVHIPSEQKYMDSDLFFDIQKAYTEELQGWRRRWFGLKNLKIIKFFHVIPALSPYCLA